MHKFVISIFLALIPYLDAHADEQEILIKRWLDKGKVTLECKAVWVNDELGNQKLVCINRDLEKEFENRDRELRRPIK